MKTAKELIIPFPWKERRIDLIEPSFLYIPGQIDHRECKQFYFDFPKTYIEFCSGTGAWVARKAKENPNILWIAVEKKFERAKKFGKNNKKSIWKI